MTLAIAFLGGVVSCLSPCVIPVIPVFMSNVAGGAAPGATFASAGFTAAGRYRAAGFLLGFAGIFVVLWVSLGLVGFALFDVVPAARQIAGLAIVALGIATIAGWQPMLSVGRWGEAGSFGGSFLLGAGVAVGWTPCIGPTLGAILTLAAASQTVWSGAALLIAYGIGMAVPILVIGLGLSRLRPVTRALTRHYRVFQVGSGLLIVGVGVLVASNSFGRLAGLVPWPF
jgi:cytochrome c-type biogenesis protein